MNVVMGNGSTVVTIHFEEIKSMYVPKHSTTYTYLSTLPQGATPSCVCDKEKVGSFVAV